MFSPVLDFDTDFLVNQTLPPVSQPPESGDLPADNEVVGRANLIKENGAQASENGECFYVLLLNFIVKIQSFSNIYAWISEFEATPVVSC